MWRRWVTAPPRHSLPELELCAHLPARDNTDPRVHGPYMLNLTKGALKWAPVVRLQLTSTVYHEEGSSMCPLPPGSQWEPSEWPGAEWPTDPQASAEGGWLVVSTMWPWKADTETCWAQAWGEQGHQGFCKHFIVNKMHPGEV